LAVPEQADSSRALGGPGSVSDSSRVHAAIPTGGSGLKPRTRCACVTVRVPRAGTYRTPEGVTGAVMERLGAEWEGWTAHDDTYVVEGENVVVLARYTAQHRGTGKPLAVRVAHPFVVRAGLIVCFEQFVDTALVRDAAAA
jgi:ketosteroid isomerase-like protein